MRETSDAQRVGRTSERPCVGTPAKPDRSACRSAFRGSSKFCGNICPLCPVEQGHVRPRTGSTDAACICWGSAGAGRLDSSVARWPRRSALSRSHRARRCCFASIPPDSQHTALTLFPTLVGHAIGRGTHRARGQIAPTEWVETRRCVKLFLCRIKTLNWNGNDHDGCN